MLPLPIRQIAKPPRTEKCVICGKDTGIDCDTPIQLREYFISGCGQLCSDCFGEIESEKLVENSYLGSSNDMQALLISIKDYKKGN